MTTTWVGRGRPAPRRVGRVLRSLTAALLAIAVVGLGSVTPSSADEQAPGAPVAITAGALEWGVRASFRGYVGAGAVGDGASFTEPGNTASAISWPVTGGSFDPVTNTTVVQFGGWVHYRKYLEGNSGIYSLDFRLANPRVEISPDGSALYADVVSRNFYGDGQMATYPNVQFAVLAPVDADVTTDATATAWSAIDARLTEAAFSAFAGFYAVGARLDPVSFQYQGPGGAPTPSAEPLDEPGALSLHTSAVDGVIADNDRTYDPINHVFHIVTLKSVGGATVHGIDTYDADDWSPVSSYVHPDELRGNSPFWVPRMFSNISIIPASATLVAVVDGGGLQRGLALTYDGATKTWTSVALPGTYTSTENTRVFSHPSEDAAYYANASFLRRLVRNTDGTFTTSELTVAGVETFVASVTNDRFIAYLRAGGLAVVDVAEVDGVLTSVVAPIAGTAEVLPYRALQRVQAAVGADGRVAVTGFDSDRLVTVAPGPDGWAVVGSVALHEPSDLVVDTANDLIYVAEGSVDRVAVVRGSEVLDTVRLPWHYYVNVDLDRNGVVHLRGYSAITYQYVGLQVHVLGTTPVVTTQPTDTTVSLTSPTGTAVVELTVAATGSPAPTYQWQTRPAGTNHWRDWVDVPGAHQPILRTEVSSADEGREYRALLRNVTTAPDSNTVPVGTVASDPAVLSVLAPPSFLQAPSDVTVAVGETAELLAMPAGNPYPEITWQRYAGGFWIAMGSELDGVEIEGGVLRILEVNEDLDGARFRVRLSSAVGTVHSTPVTLRVGEGPGAGPGGGGQTVIVEVPDLGPGELVWSVAASSPVVLGAPADGGDQWTFAGDMHPVTVIDTRLGAPAWVLSGWAGPFTGGLVGESLGWSPNVLVPGGGTVAGAPVSPSLGDGDGLRAGSVLASAPSGHVRGGATVGADLDLRVPIGAPPGTYQTTLTLTAVG